MLIAWCFVDQIFRFCWCVLLGAFVYYSHSYRSFLVACDIFDGSFLLLPIEPIFSVKFHCSKTENRTRGERLVHWYHSVSSFYGSTGVVGLGRFFSFLIHTQLLGLLGRGISPSQGRYQHTQQRKHRINAHIHPCLEWDSNPRSQLIPVFERVKTVHAWARAATVISHSVSYMRLIICTEASKAFWTYRTELRHVIMKSSWGRQIVLVVVIWLVPDVQTSAVGIDPLQRLQCWT
jgi:hypothetical protein